LATVHIYTQLTTGRMSSLRGLLNADGLASRFVLYAYMQVVRRVSWKGHLSDACLRGEVWITA
jgi:hypothetical protein